VLRLARRRTPTWEKVLKLARRRRVLSMVPGCECVRPMCLTCILKPSYLIPSLLILS
jgi:hypothetical protein